jgi:D-alanine-D-alanine ligase
MRIGLSFDLKEAVKDSVSSEGQPEDALEEYDSRETVRGIAAAIEEMGHATTPLGGGREFLSNIQKEKVDLVFNIAEGLGNYRSREAQIPGILELLGVPYSGSDPLALAVSLDKAITKSLVAAAGVLTPRWQVINDLTDLREVDWKAFPFPVFVKPLHEGSSKGIRAGSKLDTREKLMEAAGGLLERYRQPVIIEEFVHGEEITTGVIGNSPPKVLGIMRVIPRKADPNFVYSLEVKRDWERLVDYECPARLSPEVLDSISRSALKVFKVLGCRDISRVDFRIGKDDKPYFLEINPLPGLNPKSGDIVIMAGKMGWSYSRLISSIVDAALRRCGGESQSSHHL